MVKLRPVPDAPLRAVGMIRVSKERDEMIAPELQRTAIEDHCTRRGYQIVQWIEGIDESGSDRRSKWWARLDEGVELVEQHKADVVVVWKFSRTARQRLRWATAIDRVEVAGGLLESATEPLDTSTSAGRLARGMLAEFAAFEAERIGDVWREVHARRTSRGLPANGKPRFGYRVQDGIHRPHQPEAAALATLYRRYIAGESFRSLVAWLNREGILTVQGYRPGGPGPWTTSSLRDTLDSGFGAGLHKVAGSHQRGIHEPVIDAATWTAYQAARARRRTLGRSEASPYLLSKLVRCHHYLDTGQPCGAPMTGDPGNPKDGPRLRCSNVTQRKAHPGGIVQMRYVEAEVIKWLHSVADDVNTSADTAAAELARASRRKVDAKQLGREVIEIDKALARLEVNRAAAPDRMPGAVFEAARDELLERRQGIDERRLAATVEAHAGKPQKIAAQLLAEWDTLPVEQRRGTLRGLIARIEVTSGRPRATVRIVPAWVE